MKLPFTAEQFMEVFRSYNLHVFPMQIVFALMALAVISLSIWKKPYLDKMISMILSLLWLWMGVVYHWVYFSEINKGAYLFGAVFVVQGILFFTKGVLKNSLTFSFNRNPAGWAGSALLLYALVIYPLLGYILGHVYPASPTFGLPCPTTIFTFGILHWLDKKPPVHLLLIPLLWSLIGFTAALKLGIWEDTGLLAAGLLAGWLLLGRSRNFHINTRQKQ